MLQIEKGVPLPYRPQMVYPIDDMEVGDSFYVPKGVSSTVASAVASRCRVRSWDRKFTVRKVQGGIRVWRTA